MLGLLRKIFGTRNDRLLRQYRKLVDKINAFEPAMQTLSNAELKSKTEEFRVRLSKGIALNDLLPEAFAVVREASKRTLGLRHFDVQLIGGMVLHDGKISEMRTGEGKTLMATLAAYLNALTKRGVHIITVNDYLAKRDAAWMEPIYSFLGLSVGVNLTNMSHDEKQAAYAKDITYGTNNEFGFDYLRDNMVYELKQRVQPPLHFAIIDEVDSILIDEARTPLIISGQAEASSELYAKVNRLIPSLKRQIMQEEEKDEEVPDERRGDYVLDEKNRQAHLTERGHQRVEELMLNAGLIKENESLYDYTNIQLMHYFGASLRANTLYHRDVEYVVKNGEVIIVDEHTGRLMEGRRWSDGLHQAVEAKEGVEVQLENQTLATITFQNYFRMYEKLSGMTGTADTEAFEFQKIYGLEVVVIPTNQPMIREDLADKVYMTRDEKFDAILEEIERVREKGQPILVGTASIETSELLSSRLTKVKISHEVLNAKQHEREAKIIAEAGRPGSVTIATNMAGRGTDIVLGGNVNLEISELENPTEAQITELKNDWNKRHEAVVAAGGLYVLGSERHESRRIDNQLRGRSGRQGDPGLSQFFLSMEDNLLRIFGGERMLNMMRRLGVKKGDVIQHPMISRAIEKAQRRVEGHNFDIRKHLLEYDDVANDQRKVIYQQRFELLQATDVSKSVREIREEVVDSLFHQYIPKESMEEQWDVAGLEKRIEQDFHLSIPIREWLKTDTQLHEDTLKEKITQTIASAYEAKEVLIGAENLRQAEKGIMLQVLDAHWKDHLSMMDHLRQGIQLRGYAQKNPTQEFKRESFTMFTELLEQIKYAFISTLAKIEVATPEMMQAERDSTAPQLHFTHQSADTVLEADGEAVTDEEEDTVKTFVRGEPKVGRNDPCHCGSGKKFKQCHGKI
ncbi:MAG: preprotein translocase subunit SecA [Gammaproteobacteria bacterium RIFCSPLOWO2_02_FULL_42_14]|nr:MAG: preprotein translocase subunit SecA [Gammaproteobacteria bacterium RIFCSPHIGHO2_02_FULL_42_43]OGT50891.1 MAG: preprotein translocase subunit SecA [Gammaproteobacteria bacterium RIFCSPHIGHO2_12_FULL_41_25]OGT62845.1 MAG: preprotein translocase subunit SecA [Gammaproteobacteria bacterium RIFCSPLOWO2_02_FULL_42_14]OGT86803.1 MAG: preprotein translocase subunit SecA [Gammaproteobacteria bacterium RIFCSPLOWO2_12_FULL_42_18]